jgi:SAM-dependent methyltransferase
MARWTAEDKEAYRTEFLSQLMAKVPVAMEQYAHINWDEAVKGYRSDREYYPEYIHAPIHGNTEQYTSVPGCVTWDAAIEVIMPLSHKVSSLDLRDKMAEQIPADTKIESVIEIGAGTAEGALALARRFPQANFTITDISPYMLVISEEKFNQAGFADRATYAQVDARATGYPTNSFDLVTSSLLFHEMPKEFTPKILKEMYRITKPGGWILYADTYRGEYALNASFQEPYLSDFIHFNFEYEFARAGFTDIDYIRYAVGLWYMVGRKAE